MPHALCAAILASFVAASGAASPQTAVRSLPTISSRVAPLQKLDGFVPLYWDESRGQLLLEIARFNQEFLYQVSLAAGLGSNPVSLDRGQVGPSAVVRFERVGPKVLLVQPTRRSCNRSARHGWWTFMGATPGTPISTRSCQRSLPEPFMAAARPARPLAPSLVPCSI
jgi:hypothetical protein